MTRHVCLIPACERNTAGPHRPFCRRHTPLLPDDLAERLRWAFDEGDADDQDAATRAAYLFLT
jgi:hypothetical protein